MGKCGTGTLADANVRELPFSMKALLRTVEVERAIWLSSQKPKRTSALQKVSRGSVGVRGRFQRATSAGTRSCRAQHPGPVSPSKPLSATPVRLLLHCLSQAGA